MNSFFLTHPQLWDQLHDAVIATDLEGYVVACNLAAERIYGYPRAEFIGKHVGILYPEQERGTLQQVVNGVLESGRHTSEMRNVTKDGKEIYILLSVALLTNAEKEPSGMVGFSIDITKQRNAEKALRELERKNHSALAATKTGTWYWDLKSNTLTWDEQSSRLLGVEHRSEQSYEAFLQAVHPHDRDLVNGLVRQSLATGNAFEAQYRILTATGETRWLHAKGSVIDVENGSVPVTMLGIATDITDCKAVEDSLQRAEAKYRVLLESGVIGVCSANLDSIVDVNEAFCQITGYSREDFVTGRVRWQDITPDGDLPKDYAAMQQLISTGSCSPFEKEYIRKDGARIPVLVGAAVIERDPLQYSCFVLDMRTQHSAQKALRETERIATSARMGSMLAHEINNPLAALTNVMYLLTVEKESKHGELLKSANEAVQRITRITRHMVGIYAESSRPTEFKLGEILEDALAGNGARISAKGIVVLKRNDLGDKTFVGMPSDFRQLLTALVDNALDHVQPGASIHVRLGRAKAPGVAPDSGVKIVVVDNGSGIRTDHLDHVFEPFFTTKQEKATGLGLWVTRQIVQKYGGKIQIRSSTRPGRSGTFVKVSLQTDIRATHAN